MDERRAELRGVSPRRFAMRSSKGFLKCVGLVAGLGAGLGAVAQSGAVPDTAAARANEMQSRYMTPVKAEMTTKLDTKTATVGQTLAMKTDAPATLADGTVIPEGTKLTGRVVGVRAKTEETPGGSMVVVIFDKAELKDGKTIPVRVMLKTVGGLNTTKGLGGDRPGVGPGLIGDDPTMGGVAGPQSQPGMGGGGMGGGSTGGRNGGGIPSGGTTTGGVGPTGMPNGYPGTPTRRNGQQSTTMSAPSDGGNEVRMTAQGGETIGNAPKPTGLTGVMLSTNPQSEISGALIGNGVNVTLNSGTPITVGIILR
jgi:hypothetical protein